MLYVLLIYSHTQSFYKSSVLSACLKVYNVMYMFLTLMAYNYDCVPCTCMTVHMCSSLHVHVGMAAHTVDCQIISSTDKGVTLYGMGM